MKVIVYGYYIKLRQVTKILSFCVHQVCVLISNTAQMVMSAVG